MRILCLLIFTVWVVVPSSLGGDCGSLDGKWYNQLGSELILNETTSGVISGELRTAVEKTPGSAGYSHAEVRGKSLKFDAGLLFGFSAVFYQGSAVVSWLGQCLQCGGEEMLQSTWLLHDASSSSCSRHWHSTLINEDLFIRKDRVPGPRKDQDTHVPLRTTEPVDAIFHIGTHGNLNGKWYTADGIELDLIVHDTDGIIEGTYRAKDSKVLGITGSFGAGAFGLHATDESSKLAYVWVGQFYVCENGRETLETSWLRRLSAQTCERDLDATNFGRMTFVRTPPSANGDGNNWRFSSLFSDMGSKISSFFSNWFTR